MPSTTDAPLPPGTPWEFIDALGDGVYGVDTQGSCIFVNKAALAMLGYGSADDLIGRNMHETIHHTRPDGAAFPQADCPLLHTIVSGNAVRLENEMLWRRDGTPFFAEYSSFPVMSGSTISGSVITFNDTSVRNDAQTRLAVQYAVSQVLSGSADDHTVPQRILEAIGTGLRWDVGLFWRRTGAASGRDVLRCVAGWHSREAGESGAFGATSQGMALELAAGLPGRVWLMETPIHVADLSVDTPSPRRAEAARRGLRSAFAFPIQDGTTVIGAIEFYACRRIDVDENLLEAVSTLGHQIGQAFERRAAALALGDSEHLKTAILASSPDSVITVGSHGQIVEFNATAERIFGQIASQVLGHDLADLIFPAEARQSHRRAFARALSGDPTVLGRRIEFDALQADGSRFPR